MEFKINTKSNYTLIQPDGNGFDAPLAQGLRQKIEELTKLNHQNFIIDLKEQQDIDFEAGRILVDLHHDLYDAGHSIVFTNINENVLLTIKKEQLHLSLNISPTLIEAIEIINMEMVERDILNES